MLGITFHDPVRTLMAPTVATVAPTATLRDAATALAADAVGLLVVVDARGVRGVLSERDIILALTDDVELSEARVRDHASTDLVQVDEEAAIIDAANLMAAAEVRHLAVTRSDEVVGVLSVRDILGVLVAQPEAETASSRPGSRT
jgi:CBS domain-containing protein